MKILQKKVTKKTPTMKKQEFRSYDEQLTYKLKEANVELDSHGDLVMHSKEGYAELYDAGTLCIRDRKHRRLVDVKDIQKTNTVYFDKGVKVVRI